MSVVQEIHRPAWTHRTREHGCDLTNTEVVHMLIDCDACAVRGDACGNCVVTMILTPVRRGVEWDVTERRALQALADGGLLPQLRLMPMPVDLPDSAWSPRRQVG